MPKSNLLNIIHFINFSDRVTALRRDLLQPSQVLRSPSTSEVTGLVDTNIAGLVINLLLARFDEYAQLLYATNASKPSEMDNDSTDNISIAQTNPANGQHAFNDSTVIIISSSEDELEPNVAHAIEEGNGNDSTETEKNYRRRASKGRQRSLVKCRICSELFESGDALMYHLERYHREGTNIEFSCYLCNRAFPGKLSLRTHFHYMHSRQMRFPCSIANCPKYFPTKRMMQEHINGMHTKEIAFNCTKCTFKSFYKCNLMRHSAFSHHHDE